MVEAAMTTTEVLPAPAGSGIDELLRDAPVAQSAVGRPSFAHTADNTQQDALWQSYLDTRSLEARNDLVLVFRPLVAKVVKTLPRDVRAYWDDEDLKSFGLLGLLDAIERWDPSSAVARFETYAATRIRGAIYDELRRLDWLPRRLRRQVIAYRKAQDDLLGQLGRTPETVEVLDAVGLAPGESGDEILAAVSSAQLLHIQEGTVFGAGDDVVELLSQDESGDPEPRAMHSAGLLEVRRAVTKLPQRQRTVVTLHFLAGLTQEQVASLLGVSNSRVCQIAAAGIQSLRKIIAAEEASPRTA
jgi:RNA polymerase sigma factor for flagellar operon FliA